MSGEPSSKTATIADDDEGAVVRVGIYGALGRMGQMLVRTLVLEADDESSKVVLTRAILSPHDAHVGRDIGPLCGQGVIGIEATADLQASLAACDVLIDFSTAAATTLLVPAAEQARVPLVIGTTGLSAAVLQAIEAASKHIPIVRSANMSPGVNVLLGLVQKASRALADYDAEIVEIHHRHKRDAPSGTAQLLAGAIQDGRAQACRAVTGRQGLCGPRDKAELGILAVRGGDVVGDHTVMLLGSGERIELTHRASSREVFARGALRAARWVVAQSPGEYSMADVLGL